MNYSGFAGEDGRGKNDGLKEGIQNTGVRRQNTKPSTVHARKGFGIWVP